MAKPVPPALQARGIKGVVHVPAPASAAGSDHTAAAFVRIFGQDLLALVEQRACQAQPSSSSDSK